MHLSSSNPILCFRVVDCCMCCMHSKTYTKERMCMLRHHQHRQLQQLVNMYCTIWMTCGHLSSSQPTLAALLLLLSCRRSQTLCVQFSTFSCSVFLFGWFVLLVSHLKCKQQLYQFNFFFLLYLSLSLSHTLFMSRSAVFLFYFVAYTLNSLLAVFLHFLSFIFILFLGFVAVFLNMLKSAENVWRGRSGRWTNLLELCWIIILTLFHMAPELMLLCCVVVCIYMDVCMSVCCCLLGMFYFPSFVCFCWWWRYWNTGRYVSWGTWWQVLLRRFSWKIKWIIYINV